MNIPLKSRIVVVVVLALIVTTQCYPAKTKKGGNRKRTVNRHKGHGKSNAKKDSVNQRDMASIMHPGNMPEEREMENYQDYNKAFLNNEMAAESSLLANQGIDDDSALKISNMAAMPGGMEDHASSKKGMGHHGIKGNPVNFGKPNIAGFSPDEYLLDANSWPEYRIKDSDYNNKNYRVFPQGPGYPGSYMGGGGAMGGAMPYGQTAAAGMEGPYGDGNYGFPPPGQQQMVNGEREQEQEQEQEPEGYQDQGNGPSFQDEGASITVPTDRKMKHHRKQKNAAGVSYGDDVQQNDAHPNAAGSGSGHNDGSGSGASSHDIAKAISVQQDQVKTDGQVSVDTKPDGTVVTAKTSDASPAGSAAKTEQTKTESKPEEKTSPDQKQNEKSPTTENANSDSKAPSSQANAGQNGKAGAGEAPHSTLGEFAKFLKSKGITLTINKENKDSETAKQQAGKENTPPANTEQQANSQAAPSGPSSILPSAGQPTSDAVGNPTINISPEVNDGQQLQDQPLHTGVMRWRNIAPQPNQLGELFLRHKTKPHH